MFGFDCRLKNVLVQVAPIGVLAPGPALTRQALQNTRLQEKPKKSLSEGVPKNFKTDSQRGRGVPLSVFSTQFIIFVT